MITEMSKETGSLAFEVPDNRDTENQDTDYQEPDFRDSDFEKTDDQGVIEANLSDARLFGRQPRINEIKRDEREKEEFPRKKKKKSVALRRTTATQKQIAPFKSQKHSRQQIYMHLAEQDTLALLRHPEASQTLKGNEWPVYIFMLLKANEWDPQARKRRNGIRNFATEYIANGAGISESTAFEVLNRLIVKGFVRLISAGARGNIYQVSPLLAYRPDPANQRKSTEGVQTLQETTNPGPLKSEYSVHRKSVPQYTDNRDTPILKIGEPVPRKSETILNSVNLIKSKNLSLLENHFEKIYFSEIRAPKVLEDERKAFRSLVERNGDLSLEEFIECFEVVKRATDGKGNSISKKFVWMAGGFDKILREAKATLKQRQRKAELSQQFSPDLTPPQPRTVDFSENARNPASEIKTQLQVQVNSISEEISNLANRYTVQLEEGDLAKMKSLRQRREEFYLNNPEILDVSMCELWQSEMGQLDAAMNAISNLHRQYPALVELGTNRITALKSEIEAKIYTHNGELLRIRKQIHESLGIKEGSQLCRVAG